jgi:predicted acyltransferase
MAGLGAVLLGTLYYIIDVRGMRRWARPGVVFGVNAIAVFVIAGIVTRLLNAVTVAAADGTAITVKARLYTVLYASWLSGAGASLAYALGFVIVMYICMLALYKKRLYIKI